MPTELIGLTKESEEQYISESLDHIIKFVNKLSSRSNPHTYFVAEVFPKDENDKDYEPVVRKIENLTLECENDIVFGINGTGEILMETNEELVLSCFPKDNILFISHQHYSKYITISLERGYIRIYY